MAFACFGQALRERGVHAMLATICANVDLLGCVLNPANSHAMQAHTPKHYMKKPKAPKPTAAAGETPAVSSSDVCAMIADRPAGASVSHNSMAEGTLWSCLSD